jgi:ABC-2 type transport system permease protein
MLINVALFCSIFAYNKTSSILGYNLPQMIWYFIGIVLVWTFIWNITDNNLTGKIINGDMAINLLKPISMMKYELTYAIALRLAAIMFEGIPGFFVYSLFYYPKFLTLASFSRFLAVVILSFIIFFLINFLTGLSAFFIQSIHSVQSIKSILITLTAGGFIPFEFYPDWLNRICRILPFQYLIYWPIQFLLNKESTRSFESLLRIIGMQLFWIFVLYLLAVYCWKKAIQKFCAVGG